jgi:hypothetical protein
MIENSLKNRVFPAAGHSGECQIRSAGPLHPDHSPASFAGIQPSI